METKLDRGTGTSPVAPQPPDPPEPDRVIVLDEELATPIRSEALTREAKHWLTDIARWRRPPSSP